MITTLVKKEILNNLLNMRFVMAYFLCTVLLMGSAVIMVSDYLAQRKEYTTNTSIARRADNLFFLGNQPVFREPLLTSVFALGAEKDADREANLDPYLPPNYSADLYRNPMANFFPTIDLAFIIGIILSLLIFVLAFDAISGEREEGTLKVLLGGPVSRASVIGAKWIGTYATIMLPCITAWIGTALIMSVNPSITVSAQDWIRIAGMFLVAALYIACIVSLAIMVSTMMRIGTSVLLALLTGWVVLVVGVPSLSGPVAALLTRLPAAQELQATTQRYSTHVEKSGIHLDPAIASAFERELAGRDYGSLPKEERKRLDSIGVEANRDRDHTYMDKVAELTIAYLDKRIAAENLARWISRISPYGCFQNACVTLAGTGIERQSELTRTVLAHNRVIFDFTTSPQAWCPECRTPENGPAMTMPRRSVLSAAVQTLPDVGILALMTVLFFMAAFTSFLRQEIT